MDWEKLFLKYIWNDQTTPYLVPLDKLNQRQGNSEILIYSLFLGVFFGIAAIRCIITKKSIGKCININTGGIQGKIKNKGLIGKADTALHTC